MVDRMNDYKRLEMNRMKGRTKEESKKGAFGTAFTPSSVHYEILSGPKTLLVVSYYETRRRPVTCRE